MATVHFEHSMISLCLRQASVQRCRCPVIGGRSGRLFLTSAAPNRVLNLGPIRSRKYLWKLESPTGAGPRNSVSGASEFCVIGGMFSVVFFTRFEELEFSIWKVLFLLAVLFSMFCYTLDLDRLGKAFWEAQSFGVDRGSA